MFFRSLKEKWAEAQRVKVSRIYEYMTNARKDDLDKILTEIIKNHGVIGVEELQVSETFASSQLCSCCGYQNKDVKN